MQWQNLKEYSPQGFSEEQPERSRTILPNEFPLHISPVIFTEVAYPIQVETLQKTDTFEISYTKDSLQSKQRQIQKFIRNLILWNRFCSAQILPNFFNFPPITFSGNSFWNIKSVIFFVFVTWMVCRLLDSCYDIEPTSVKKAERICCRYFRSRVQIPPKIWPAYSLSNPEAACL